MLAFILTFTKGRQCCWDNLSILIWILNRKQLKESIKVQGRAKIAFSVYCQGPYRKTQNQNPLIKFSMFAACGETLQSNQLHNNYTQHNLQVSQLAGLLPNLVTRTSKFVVQSNT